MTSRIAGKSEAPWWPDRAVASVRHALLAHPAVARLDGGVFGDVATHTTSGRILGVLLGSDDEPVEIAVVLRLDRPVPEIVAELRERIRAVLGPIGVDVTVSDVLLASPSTVDVR